MSAAGGGGRRYGARLVVMIVGTLAVAAFALTVIFASGRAFPIRVFGTAEVDGVNSPPIRGANAGGVLRGAAGDFLLPEELVVGGGAWAPADPMLDEARRLASVERWDPAIALYDRLVEDRPAAEALAIERARVLSWAGRPVAAGEALRAIALREPVDGALLVEAASFYWWGGDPETADEVLSQARAAGVPDDRLEPLLSQVRDAMTPDARAARRWVAESPTWENRLALARAYLTEMRWLDAVDEFDLALMNEAAPDSAYLEMAAAATAADSTGIAVVALREYLRRHPGDAATRLSLARTHSWAEDYEAAIAEYERYLAVVDDDPTARYELAQILAWTEQNARAASELRRVALAQPLHAPTYRLLGDLALWRGDYDVAIANYRYASDLAPADHETRSALASAEADYARMRMAALPLPLGACTLAFETFTDSEGFAWVETRGSRVWRGDWGAVEVQARQSLSQSEHAFGGGGRRLGGFGAAVALYLPVSQTARIDLLAGTTDYGDFGSYVQAGLGFEAREVAGATLAARYTRGPAVQRAATLASLQAGTTSDLLQITASRPFGDWSGWSSVELERLDSEYGTTMRYGASVSFSRPLSSRVSVNAAISALATRGEAPALPDGRPLYWAPELYVTPSVGVTYRLPIGSSWSVAGTLTPGWAFVRERPTGEQRFGRGHQPTLGAGLEVGYTAGDWALTGLADWGGSVDATGYRASTVRVQGAYRLGEP